MTIFRNTNIKGDLETKLQLGLTFEELYVVHLLYHIAKGNEDAKDAYRLYVEKFNEIASECGDNIQVDKIPLSDESIERISKTGLLVNINKKTGSYSVNTTKFREILIDKQDAINELISTFRGVRIIMSDGKTFNVIGTTNYDTLAEKYARAIDFSIVNHNNVVEICKQAVEHELVTCGLERIIESRR